MKLLLVAAKWWPLSARLAMALIRQGCRVCALCPPGHPLEYVVGVERIASYRGVRSMRALSRALHELDPDLVLPCDDGVVAQLHALHAADAALKPLIERSLGGAENFPVTTHRFRLLEVAAELAILVPETRRVTGSADLVTWHEHVASAAALKIDGECGGNGVRICDSLEQSMKAWRELSTPGSLATACKRLLINRDPLALWAHRQRRSAEVTIQRVIRGRPANAMLACRNGELLGVVCVAVLASEGATGAATVIQRIRNEAMERAAERLAARLGLSGFYGLDFMIETGTDLPYLIEMNPRCTQLGHLQFAGAPSLAEAFATALCGAPREAGEDLPLDVIALFPQALNARRGTGPASAAHSYLDVPWQEPDLIAELKRTARPERGWLSRLYHAVKPMAEAAGVEYGEFLPTTRATEEPPKSAAMRLVTGKR